jgi:hypothetical protein
VNFSNQSYGELSIECQEIASVRFGSAGTASIGAANCPTESVRA